MMNRIVKLSNTHINWLKKLISNDKSKFRGIDSPIHDEVFKILNEAPIDFTATEHIEWDKCDDSSVTQSDDRDDLGDMIFSLEEFTECVRGGLFNDDDGLGEYANYNPINQDDDKIIKSDLRVYPSDVDTRYSNGGLDQKYTHVVWYNK